MSSDSEQRTPLDRVVRFVVRMLVTAAIGAGVFDGSFGWTCLALASASAAGAVVGALGGYLAGRRKASRALRLHWRELVARGAWYGTTAAWLWVCLDADEATGWGAALRLGLQTGAFWSLVGVLAGALLSKPERAFARAQARLRDGDVAGARKALQEYVANAKEDPAREARLPAAEQWLRGETSTLDVVTELQAASAPEGRGTEVSAAEQPAGSGTELLSEPEAAPAPEAEPTARQAPPPEREPPGPQRS